MKKYNRKIFYIKTDQYFVKKYNIRENYVKKHILFKKYRGIYIWKNNLCKI